MCSLDCRCRIKAGSVLAGRKEEGRMKITLDEERRAGLRRALQAHYRVEFDEALSDFKSETLLDVVLAAVAPEVYNQAVQDVRAHLQAKLDDLDGEVYMD